MKDFWIYNLLRFGLLLAAFGVVSGVWAAIRGGSLGSGDLLGILIVSFLLSGLASYFLLNKQREKVAASIEQRTKRYKRNEDF